MKAWVAAAAVLLLSMAASPGSLPTAGADVAPSAGRESNTADVLRDLEWVSRDATCKASSALVWGGRAWVPHPSLLTEDEPNTCYPDRAFVIFHTEIEENPHIIITLRETCALEGIFIENLRFDPVTPGYDSMFQRAAKMAVWLSPDGNSWEMVWRAQGAEKSWTIRLAKPVAARHVKIGLLGRDYFHLTKVRLYGPSADLPPLTRGADADRIVLRDGKALVGTIEDQACTVTGALGKVEIPMARVAGIVPEPNEPARARVVQTDGQVIAGALSAQSIRIRLNADSTLTVPWREIRQVGYRISKDKPATIPACEPCVLLRGGDRLIWTGVAQKMCLATTYGQIELPHTRVQSMGPVDPSGEAFRVNLHGGSTLTGALAPRKLTLKLRTFPDLEIDANDVRRLVWAAASAPPAGSFTLTMRNGDRLIGRLAEESLSVRTESGDVKVDPVGLKTAAFDAHKPDHVTVRMWDDSVVAGRLADATLRVVTTADGPVAAVKAAQIASITNSSPLPPPDTQKRVQALIAALGAESFRDREAAQQALVAMGKPILPLLEPHRKSEDTEVRMRIEALIEQLKPGQ